LTQGKWTKHNNIYKNKMSFQRFKIKTTYIHYDIYLIRLAKNFSSPPHTTTRGCTARPLEFRTTRGLREPQNRIISVCLARTLNCFFHLSLVHHTRTIRAASYIHLYYYVVAFIYNIVWQRSSTQYNDNNTVWGFE